MPYITRKTLMAQTFMDKNGFIYVITADGAMPYDLFRQQQWIEMQNKYSKEEIKFFKHMDMVQDHNTEHQIDEEEKPAKRHKACVEMSIDGMQALESVLMLAKMNPQTTYKIHLYPGISLKPYADLIGENLVVYQLS